MTDAQVQELVRAIRDVGDPGFLTFVMAVAAVYIANYLAHISHNLRRAADLLALQQGLIDRDKCLEDMTPTPTLRWGFVLALAVVVLVALATFIWVVGR